MTMIHQENLILALQTAIKTQSALEHRQNNDPNFKSALVAGWESTLASLLKGERVHILQPGASLL